MPGRDGTGPTGKGPMTGAGSGKCMLRIPDNQDEPIRGFAGEAGRPILFDQKPDKEKEEFEMPYGDGTGPTGAGPRGGRTRGTGRGGGVSERPDRSRRQDFPGAGGCGRGRRNRFSKAGTTGERGSAGLGFGGGSGWSSPSDPDFAPEARLETLKAQARHLEEALDAIRKRIQSMGCEMEEK